MYEYSVSKPILVAKDVCVTLGEKKILNNMNFTVKDVHRAGHQQGQIVGLLGPSGCGKTTLFRRIAGLDDVDSGQILIGLKQEPTRAGRVGVVMQHYPLFPHRTVMGNMMVAGRQTGLSGKEVKEKAEGLLKTFELSDRADAWPAELSGGQRQRIAIAQQLMCSEHMLLMDEPFSGLDPVANSIARSMIQHVASLHEENTIVIVTHDIEAAVQVCDQLIIVGRDPKDRTSGAFVRADIDLKARGIAWRPNNEELSVFTETVREIKSLFKLL